MGYAKYHQSRANLLIHLVAVPVFVICIVGLFLALARGAYWYAFSFALGNLLSLVAQGKGHKLEPVPPEPFAGRGDFLQRILSEQFGRFWVFLFRGGWSRVLRGSNIAT